MGDRHESDFGEIGSPPPPLILAFCQQLWVPSHCPAKIGLAAGRPRRILNLSTNVSMLAIVAALTLAACGSGSKGGVSFSASGPRAGGGTPTISDARILPFVNVEAAMVRAANVAPAFVVDESVTQSSINASVSSTFDGSEITVTVNRTGLTSTTLSSVNHSVQETLDRSPLVPFPSPPGLPNGHDTYEDWTLFNYSETGTSSAYVLVSWNRNNPTDFLANGYWMLLDGNLQSDLINNAEVGAFIGGSEFSNSPATLPASGTATFRGRSSGMYTFYYGPAWAVFDPVLPGTQDSGIYTGIATLTANFANNTIEGCVGCLVPGASPGIVVGETVGDTIFPIASGSRGELKAVYHNFPFDGDITRISPDDIDLDNLPGLSRMILKPAPIDRDTGTFMVHDGVTFQTDYFPGGTATGSWGGRFSNRPAGNGSDIPRLVGGTIGSQWSHPTAGRTRLVGVFFAAPTAP